VRERDHITVLVAARKATSWMTINLPALSSRMLRVAVGLFPYSRCYG
jgi:hypothetical protein